MTPEEIARRRMHNLGLVRSRFHSIEDVVGSLVAVQSQDYHPAKWSVASRSEGVDDAALDRAFAEGRILRTHLLRPTWHFVLPTDIRWLLELTAPRIHALNAYMYRQQELDDVTLKRSVEVIADALRGRVQLTRKEVAAVLEEAGIPLGGFRLGYILMNAELERVVCSGALKGKQHTYASFDERALDARSLDRDEAVAELVDRYFTSHGPATVKDFQAWSSLTIADIKRGLEIVGSRLASQVAGGLTYWFAASPPPPEVASPAVQLVQGYDEYIVGYRESKFLLDIRGVAGPMAGDRPAFNGVILVDDQVAGAWRRVQRKDSVAIESSLYRPFNRAERAALRAAADRYASFLGVSEVFVDGERKGTR
ncbi:MAG: winged helix DNA-binding domain-containing protein [Actinomycetota bacterium]